MLPGIFLYNSCYTKKLSEQDRTAAERNYVAESNPPQAEESCKAGFFLEKIMGGSYGRDKKDNTGNTE